MYAAHARLRKQRAEIFKKTVLVKGRRQLIGSGRDRV